MPTLGEQINSAVGRAEYGGNNNAMMMMAILQILAQASRDARDWVSTERNVRKEEAEEERAKLREERAESEYGWATERRKHELEVERPWEASQREAALESQSYEKGTGRKMREESHKNEMEASERSSKIFEHTRTVEWPQGLTTFDISTAAAARSDLLFKQGQDDRRYMLTQRPIEEDRATIAFRNAQESMQQSRTNFAELEKERRKNEQLERDIVSIRNREKSISDIKLESQQAISQIMEKDITKPENEIEMNLGLEDANLEASLMKYGEQERTPQLRSELSYAMSRQTRGAFDKMWASVKEKNPNKSTEELSSIFNTALNTRLDKMAPHVVGAFSKAMSLSGAGETPGVQSVWSDKAVEKMRESEDDVDKAIYFAIKNDPKLQKKIDKELFLSAIEVGKISGSYPNGQNIADEIELQFSSPERIVARLGMMNKLAKPQRSIPEHTIPFIEPLPPEYIGWANPYEPYLQMYRQPGAPKQALEYKYKTKDAAQKAIEQMLIENPDYSRGILLQFMNQELENQRRNALKNKPVK